MDCVYQCKEFIDIIYHGKELIDFSVFLISQWSDNYFPVERLNSHSNCHRIGQSSFMLALKLEEGFACLV